MCRVSEVLHSIFGWFQSIPKRFLPASSWRQFLGRMDLVLLLWQTAYLQPMVLERAEDVRGLWSSSRPRLWSARRDCAGSQNVAPFELKAGRYAVVQFSSRWPMTQHSGGSLNRLMNRSSDAWFRSAFRLTLSLFCIYIPLFLKLQGLVNQRAHWRYP
jgi:hypothetical protein